MKVVKFSLNNKSMNKFKIITKNIHNHKINLIDNYYNRNSNRLYNIINNK